MKTINIANDFSSTPSGRYKNEGTFSGENFRDNILIPALKVSGKLTIVLDGVFGFGSSFLEESFGGLIRNSVISKKEALSRLNFISEEDPSYIDEIREYINDAN